jgi:hypothetical protein
MNNSGAGEFILLRLFIVCLRKNSIRRKASKRREAGVSQLAEKCKGWSKKRLGTTSVVPQAQQKNAGL